MLTENQHSHFQSQQDFQQSTTLVTWGFSSKKKENSVRVKNSWEFSSWEPVRKIPQQNGSHAHSRSLSWGSSPYPLWLYLCRRLFCWLKMLVCVSTRFLYLLSCAWWIELNKKIIRLFFFFFFLSIFTNPYRNQ